MLSVMNDLAPIPAAEAIGSDENGTGVVFVIDGVDQLKCPAPSVVKI
jgi:hypothetical protein